MALFVFVFMAATLHFSFFKGFYYDHGSKGKFGCFEGSSISEIWETTATKIGVHACYINPYLHEFFGRISIN